MQRRQKGGRRPVQRGVRRRVHLIAASCLTETIRLAALALNRFGGASPLGRAFVRGTLARSGGLRLRCHELAIRDPAPNFTARRLTACGSAATAAQPTASAAAAG